MEINNRLRGHPLGNDPIFLQACELAEIPPSYRQGQKWMKGRGIARQFERAARAKLDPRVRKEMEVVS